MIRDGDPPAGDTRRQPARPRLHPALAPPTARPGGPRAAGRRRITWGRSSGSSRRPSPPAPPAGTDFRGSITSSSWIEPAGEAAGRPFLQDLIEAGPRLPEQTATRPYYAARHGIQLAEPDRRPDPAAARRDWLAAVSALRRRGYLARVAPEVCVDGGLNDPDPDDVIDGEIADRLGISELWKERARADWDDATFFSLVEVLHDLVERPRNRDHHSYGNCGWHYSDFAPYPAQVLFRWTVNRILARHGIDLVLAKSGENVGRNVHQPHDGRAALVESAVGTPDPATQSTVEHAVALFRRRGATREDKRSACVALAGLIEERRALLKDRLTKRDEGALFQIANEFAVRHRNAKQYANYDES